jgi:1-deoxy-D-xylulose-5-phosphate synthase
VLELLSQKQITTPVVRIGWPDQYIEHASSVDYLRERHSLTVPAIVEKVREALKPPVAETAPKIASMVGR